MQNTKPLIPTDMSNPTKIVTGKVRFSYCNVFSPRVNEGDNEGDGKYTICILVDKNDKFTIEKIKQAVEAAIANDKPKLANKNGVVNRATLKLPLRDGDLERSDDPSFEGKLFLNATSKRKPGIVDADLNPIINPDDFYSGCYGRASLNFYGYDFNGTKGIAVGLNNLQKLEDGEPLGGFSSAEDDFGGENAYNDPLLG